MIEKAEKSWTAKISVLVLTALVAANGPRLQAAEGDDEFYSVRPAIETIKTANEDLGKQAQKLLTGVVDYIAEMRAFYPNADIYILARDGEAVYDLWRLLYPEDFERQKIKLVNISTVLSADANLTNYLKSTGMMEDIERGHQVIALDTGYEGTIINAINGVLKKKGTLYAHLMSARHMHIPSSRVSTRPFLDAAKRKKDVEDNDYVSEAADMAVLALEDIQHYTETAHSFTQLGNGKWEPTSLEVGTAERNKALKFMAGVKRFGQSAEVRRQAARSTELFAKVMVLLNGDRPVTREQVKALSDELLAEELEGVWADLRESIGKGLVTQYNPLRYKEIFDALPAKLKALDDIWEEDGLGLVEAREEEIEGLAANYVAAQIDEQTDGDFWVVDIIRLYLKGLEEMAEREAIFKDFKKKKKEFRRPIRGDEGAIGEKLGEGIRSDVYELGDTRIIKVAYDAEDMTALEGEKLVFDFLKKNQEKYPLRLLEITEMGPKGIFLIKPLVDKAAIGKYILKKNGDLTPQQLRSLEEVYNIARKLAQDTGISLDIKSDNLYWTSKGWVILDLGPRTMSHPYFFTLECQTFQQYLDIWNSDSGSRSGVMDVEDFIKQSRRECEAAVIKGYRELKADD